MDSGVEQASKTDKLLLCARPAVKLVHRDGHVTCAAGEVSGIASRHATRHRCWGCVVTGQTGGIVILQGYREC